jgi:hypothetical protein
MSGSPLSFAVVTPSYAADHERCRLLCESLDAMADGPYRHYLLVADHDLPLFAPMAGPRRAVIADSAILPAWLRAVRRPLDRAGRHVWISTDIRRQVRPMSGWHVQQLRKLAAPSFVDEDVIVMADSDSVFVRPVNAAYFLRDGRVRLYRKPKAIAAANPADGLGRHADWTRHSCSALGLPPPTFPADDFINNVVSWRKDRALEVVRRIEELSGSPLAVALGRVKTFSEYQIYGAYSTQALVDAGHFDSADALSHTYWSGEALTAAKARDFMRGLAPGQIAVCVQSFTGTTTDVMRSLIRTAERG